MNSVAPASCARFGNEYYATDEELLYACADAMREEYTAIIDAGLILQLDDPAIAENWDQINPEPSVEAYQRYTMVRIEALNHAIRGLPAGPHPLPPLLGQLARPAHHRHPDGGHRRGDARGQRRRTTRSRRPTSATSTSGASGEDVKLPDGKVLLPGIVSHATNVIEHPRGRRRPDRALRRGASAART